MSVAPATYHTINIAPTRFGASLPQVRPFTNGNFWLNFIENCKCELEKPGLKCRRVTETTSTSKALATGQ
jgi:hypothetical protein